MLKHWLRRRQSPAWTLAFAVVVAALIAAALLTFALIAQHGVTVTTR